MIHAPKLVADLAPPATDAQLAALAQAVGRPVPDELRASLLCHDGQLGRCDGALGRWEGLSCERIARHHAEMRARVADGDPLHDEGLIAGPGVRARWFDPAWIPFAGDGIGDSLVVDTAPAPEGVPGQIVHYRHDVERRVAVATSLAAWMSTLADELEAGVFQPGHGGESLRRRRQPP